MAYSSSFRCVPLTIPIYYKFTGVWKPRVRGSRRGWHVLITFSLALKRYACFDDINIVLFIVFDCTLPSFDSFGNTTWRTSEWPAPESNGGFPCEFWSIRPCSECDRSHFPSIHLGSLPLSCSIHSTCAPAPRALASSRSRPNYILFIRTYIQNCFVATLNMTRPRIERGFPHVQ
jgi:hypothetical protein